MALLRESQPAKPRRMALPFLWACLSIVIPLLLTAATFAATLSVPGDFPSIQAGIDGAASGDTVRVGPGTYRENIDFNGKKSVWKALMALR